MNRDDDLVPDQIWTAKQLRAFRASVIEECAQIAETHLADTDSYLDGDAIAAAIRALKDK